MARPTLATIVLQGKELGLSSGLRLIYIDPQVTAGLTSIHRHFAGTGSGAGLPQQYKRTAVTHKFLQAVTND